MTLHQQPHGEDGDQAANPEDGFERQAEDLAGVEHGRRRRAAAAFQPALAQDEGDQAQRHADAGQAEAIGPAVFDAEVGTGRRGQHRTQVDADVEDGEPAVATRIVLFIQGADDGRDVGLQEAHADDDQRQGEEQDRLPKAEVPRGFQRIAAGGREGREAGRLDHSRGGRVSGHGGSGFSADARDAFGRNVDLDPLVAVDGEDRPVLVASIDLQFVGRGADGQVFTTAVALEGHHEVTGDQQDGADDDRLARAEVFVGDHAADDRHQIDQRRIGRIDALRLFRTEQKMLGQVEDQDRPHPIIGKAFPHFREKKNHQPPRVTQEGLARRRRQRAPSIRRAQRQAPLILRPRRAPQARRNSTAGVCKQALRTTQGRHRAPGRPQLLILRVSLSTFTPFACNSQSVAFHRKERAE
ncbi:hypothetical protein D3C77_411970 [compost metagenome]